MIYRVELTVRAQRDLRRLYRDIDAANYEQARVWFNGLEAALLSLEESPNRSPATPENPHLRQLLYASKSYVYRVIYRIDDKRGIVSVIHIRHGSRRAM